MDFKKILSMATHNEQYSSYVTPAKRYSTELSAPKKPPKSNVQSAAVKAFLDKKQQEEKIKVREFERKKQDLLELRSIAKHNRKATAMAKRTKDNNFMANFSFMEELAKNGGNWNASKLPTSYQRCPIDDRLQSLTNRKSSEKRDRSPPYRGSDNDRHGSSLSRSRSEPMTPSNRIKSDKYCSENPMRNSATVYPADRKSAPTRKPPPPQNGLNFHQLLKLAAVKQHEPVEVLKTKKTVKDVDFQGRLMTNDEKRHFIEEQTRKQGRSLSEATLPAPSRRRRKFTKDADEGGDLVVSNLSPNKAPQNSCLKNKIGGEIKLPQIRKLAGEPQRSNTEPVRARQSDPMVRGLAPVKRDRTELEQRQPIPKRNANTTARNVQKPNQSSLQRRDQPSASKQNYPTKQMQAPQHHHKANPPPRASTSSNLIRDERTKVPVRTPNGSANSKMISLQQPSQRLPQNRATNGQVPSKMTKFRDPAVLRQPPPSGEVLKKMPNRDCLPKQLPAKISMGKQIPSRNPPPKQGPTREVLKQFPPKELLPKQFSPQDVLPKRFPPRDLLPKQFPPRDLLPKQFPPRDLLPKQFPPRDMLPQQFPPRDVRRPPSKPVKRRIESDDEYDEEMVDFIDDGPIDGENMDISEQIKEIFGYDRNKYRYEHDDDLDIMESSFAQQMREEAISTKLGILEDLEDIRREQEELKGKYRNVKKKKK